MKRVQSEGYLTLLDMATILSGKLRLKSQIVEIASLVQNVTATFRESADSKNIQLVETISDQVPSNLFVDAIASNK